MRRTAGDYEIDDDPGRVDADAAAAFLTTQAYRGRWRGVGDVKGQIATAWRVVGVYNQSGAMVRASPARSATAGRRTWPTCTCCPGTGAPGSVRPSCG